MPSGRACNSEDQDVRDTMRRSYQLLGITCVILALEIVGGWWSGSLALLADAGHVFTDNIAVITYIVVNTLLFKGKGQTARTYGFIINTGLLVFIALWIWFEAFRRYQDPQTIESLVMLSVAIVGGVGNWFQHHIHDGTASHHKHEVHQTLSVHIISDLLQSIGVVMGAIAIWWTGWIIIDLMISAIIGGWILYQATTLVLNRNSAKTPCH